MKTTRRQPGEPRTVKRGLTDRRRGSAIRRAAAFTVAELVVSIGVLGLLLLTAGAVFTLTLKSSGQATAIIEVSESIRNLEQTLRADLAAVQPRSSMMVIQGNRIGAYWTRDQLEADADGNPMNGYPSFRDPLHERVTGVSGSSAIVPELQRADLLMFFTNNPSRSSRDPSIQARVQQVVYGHANLSELDRCGQWTAGGPGQPLFANARLFAPDNMTYAAGTGTYSLDPASNGGVEPFPLPARDLHLARRSVLILDQPMASPPHYPAPGLNDADPSLDTVNDDDPQFTVPDSTCPGLVKRFCLLDGRRDYVVSGGGSFDYNLDVVYRAANPAFDKDPSDTRAAIHWVNRSYLDTDVPIQQYGRLGAHMLPHCASFKVEWAVEMDIPATCTSTKDLIWIDPLDFGKTIVDIQERIDAAATPNPDCAAALESLLRKLVPADPSDPVPEKWYPSRFIDPSGFHSTSVPVQPTHIFYSSRPPLPTAGYLDVPDPLFPKALRITVDVYDSAGRLERPIRHVMILPVGGQ